MELTKNKAVLDWIDQQVKLTQPKEFIWIDGSEAQLEELRKLGPQRRGPRGEPDLHLLQKAGGCRPHQQLDGSPGNVRQAEQAL